VVWVVAALDGDKLSKLSKRTVVEYTKITNFKVLGQQVKLDDSYSYPYTFTLLVGSQKAGPEGEGEYEVCVYT